MTCSCRRCTDAREQQEETKEQFASALEEFRATFGTEENQLSKAYDALNDNYDDSEAEAERLRAEIAKVKDVAADLFSEWDEEIEEQTNASFKASMAQAEVCHRHQLQRHGGQNGRSRREHGSGVAGVQGAGVVSQELDERSGAWRRCRRTPANWSATSRA